MIEKSNNEFWTDILTVGKNWVLSHKNMIFYLFVFVLTVYGCVNSFHVIYQYSEKLKEPISLINLHFYRGDIFYLYRNLFFLFIFDGLGIFYVIKNISMNKLIKMVSIFIVIMYLFLVLKSYDIFPYRQIPDNLSFFYVFYVLGNILFDNPYATINQTVLGFWLLIFFPLKSKIDKPQKIAKLKLLSIVLITIIDMIVMPFFFPQFFVK